MTAPARFRQSDVQRALKAAQRSGYHEVRVKIAVDGGLEIIVGKGAQEERPPVELD